ncbi:hypothetical protein [Nitrosopumilus ureiphilus]|uniref:Uncharacterized protein n=1 Tax=Nitrosopumilus ureiphilus TaxID=1470067 RepID=A0A7D5R749_9ARCH|nr:hypothetical protein [Nitrosopumilus ureiphilus]QLH06499.1 hypothetical protein C5F50_04995 [Nitrosopumilus ureiphilus]
MKSRLLIIIGIAGIFLVPINSAQGLPSFLDCKYDSSFVISTNKLEFTQGETFVLNVKTIQNDTSFEVLVINPKGQEVFADVVDGTDKFGYTQARFHIPDDALQGTWSIFVTAKPSQQQQVIFIGVDETPQSIISIKSSYVNYEYKVDDASFLVAGEPNTGIQINVLDHNNEKTNIYIITLTPEGKCNFTLDLDGYKPGVYAVEVTDHNDKAIATFTVGLQPSTGQIDVSTDSAKYSSGETVLISVESGPMIKLQISIMGPLGNVIEKILATTDQNGRLSESFTIPQNATEGTWSIKSASGSNFDITEFTVIAQIDSLSKIRMPPSISDPMYLWNDKDLILDGNIFSIRGVSENVTAFDIKINKFFKGESASDMITVFDYDSKFLFPVGQDALIYLKKIENSYEISPYTVETTINCSARDRIPLSTLPGEPIGRGGPTLEFVPDHPCIPSYYTGILSNNDSSTDTVPYRTPGGSFSPDKTVYPTPWEDRPPLKQFKDGIDSKVIHCNDDLVLVQKYNGFPACVREQTIPKLIERGWNNKNSENTVGWKKYIMIESSRIDKSRITDRLTIHHLGEIQHGSILNKLFVGVDGCKNKTDLCALPRGISLDKTNPLNIPAHDSDTFSVTLNEKQANYLFSQLEWIIEENWIYTAIQWKENYYLLVFSTFDQTRTPDVKMKLVDIPLQPVSLESGGNLNYTIQVDAWATYGTSAQIDLSAVQSAKDSGMDVWIEPETLIIPERSNATATLFIQASDDANAGIYDVRVIGYANGNNAGLHCSNTICPTINIGNSNWSIRTFGSGTNMAIGGISQPDNTWMEIELNKNEFFEDDIVEIKTYLVNNSTDTLTFIPDQILIKVIKAQPVGYYENLYGINARYESDEPFILEPNSKTLLVRPFYWNQMTFQNFDDEQRLEPRQHKMIAKFVGENHAWNDDVMFEIK